MELKFHSLVFDLDGTLINSKLDFSVIRNRLGLSPGEPILEALDLLPYEERNEKQRLLIEWEKEGSLQAELMEGARSVLNRLEQKALLTRNSRTVVVEVLKKLNLHFNPVICREDAPPKPKPHGLLRIAKEWGLPPQNLAYVGDYLFDLQAARAANMKAILYCPGDEPSWSHEADLVIKHFEELLDYLK